jgi:hypothetical protein
MSGYLELEAQWLTSKYPNDTYFIYVGAFHNAMYRERREKQRSTRAS